MLEEVDLLLEGKAIDGLTATMALAVVDTHTTTFLTTKEEDLEVVIAVGQAMVVLHL